MFGLSFGEIVVVGFLFAIVAGTPVLARVGGAVGELMAGYKKGARDDDERIRVRADDD